MPPRSITVLYFAAVREAAGTSEDNLTLPDEVRTVAEFAEYLARARPALAGRLGGVRYAVNEVFAEPTASLAPGDIVAVIPPVSGG